MVIDEVQRLPASSKTVAVLVDRPGQQRAVLLLAAPRRSRQGCVGIARGRFASSPRRFQPVRGSRRPVERSGCAEDFRAPTRPDPKGSRCGARACPHPPERDNTPARHHDSAPGWRRFWTMIAHYPWTSGTGRSLRGHSVRARDHPRFLEGSPARSWYGLLPPWFENLKKRQRQGAQDLRPRKVFCTHCSTRCGKRT